MLWQHTIIFPELMNIPILFHSQLFVINERSVMVDVKDRAQRLNIVGTKVEETA